MPFNAETVKNVDIFQLPQSVYDALVRNGEVDPNALYLTTDDEGNVGVTKEVLTILLNGQLGIEFDGSEAKTLDILPSSIGAATMIQKKDSVVQTSAWVASTTNENYPYQATIELEGVLETMLPDVCFAFADAVSSNFAPISESIDGGVIIYAKEIPTAAITIPVITLWAQ